MVREKVRVTGLTTADGPGGPRVTGVRTDAGDVEAEVVVNCAGQWAKAVAELAAGLRLTVPLHSAEHFYVVTEEIAGVHPDLPIMRDPDGWTYFKEEVGGLVVGGFEPDAKPWVAPDQIPHPFEFQLLDEDWEHFSILMEQALIRVPALETTGIRKFYNGPESFTPDNQFLLGEVPGLRGFFVGAGFNSVGIASAGGAGRALAEWIVDGVADLRPGGRRRTPVRAVRRGQRLAALAGGRGARPALRDPVAAARAGDRRATCASLRCTTGWPQHGAHNGSRMGWERPLYFVPSGERDGYDAEAADRTWTKPAWLPWSAAEQRATREAVAVFDQTSFSKYVVSGPGALEALQWVCAADVDVPVDHCVYTPFLNARATYEADLTVTRVAEDEFWLVSSSATTVRDLDWLGRHAFDRVGRVRRRRGPHRRLLGARRDGSALARAAGGAHRRRPERGGLRLRDQPGDHAGRGAGAGDPDDLRRRARLGADGAGRARARGARRPARGGRALAAAARSTPATTRSSRCAWRRASGRSAASSPPTTRRSRPGLVFATALDPASTRTSWAATALEAHRAALAAGRAAAPTGLARRRRRRAHALGRRAAPPRRSSGRAGDQRGVGRDGGLVRRAGLRPPRRAGRPATGSPRGRHDVDVAGTAYPVTLSLRAPL